MDSPWISLARMAHSSFLANWHNLVNEHIRPGSNGRTRGGRLLKGEGKIDDSSKNALDPPNPDKYDISTTNQYFLIAFSCKNSSRNK
jgi:hypothetical protein